MRKLILFLILIRIQIDTSTILKFSGYYKIELYVIYHNLIGFTYKLFSHQQHATGTKITIHLFNNPFIETPEV